MHLGRTVAVTAALGMLLAACGQKPGVFVDDPLAGGTLAVEGTEPVAGAVPTEDLAAPLDDTPVDDVPDEAAVADPGTSDAPTAGAPQTTTSAPREGGGGPAPRTSDRGGDDEAAPPSGRRTPQGSDRTGVTDSTITVAIHAPITGAAPLPATSFERARSVYWENLKAQGDELLGGRDVRVIFRDDRFAPDVARQVCRELANESVLLSGAGGTDQIQACGQLAAQLRIPYLSPGVTEAGLEGNPWYFAQSMTYSQQGPLLAQMVKKEFGDARTAAVIMNTPNFNDGVAGWEAGARQHGVNYFRTFRSERSSNPNFGPIIQQLQADGVEVVYVNMSPLNYIQFAQTAGGQGLDLQYVGVGVTMGLNAVLGSGCPDVDGGIFFSPFPALETADRLDPDFRRASQRFNAPTDDIAWATWGANKNLHRILQAYEDTFGDDVTREDLRTVIETQGPFETGVFPPASFSPERHFGGTAVHVLRADCGRGQYLDAGTFVTKF